MPITGSILVAFYCLDRVLRHRHVYDPGNWTDHVEPGYYGEEFHGCSIDALIRQHIVQDLRTLQPLSSNDALRQVLQLEYGYLLPILQQCQFTAQWVPRTQIQWGSPNQYTRVFNENVEHYRAYKLPRCVCRLDNDGIYWIVDGYPVMGNALRWWMK